MKFQLAPPVQRQPTPNPHTGSLRPGLKPPASVFLFRPQRGRLQKQPTKHPPPSLSLHWRSFAPLAALALMSPAFSCFHVFLVFLLGFLDPAAGTAAACIMTTPAPFCGDCGACVKILLGVLGGLARGDFFRTPASPLPATENSIHPQTKRAAVASRSFVSSYGKDYLLSLRRMTIAKAPRPRRPIVAGSGTGVAPTVKYAL